MKNYLILLKIFVLLIFCQSTHGQYKISGYLISDKPNKTVYLAILRFDEESAQSKSQIITSVKTDSSGYFEITGILLSEQNKFYRIYSNISETSLDLIRTPERKNFRNFIFSNKDTIFFPKNSSRVWFDKDKNTNFSDKEWEKINEFENSLINEFRKTQNAEIIEQTQKSFLSRYKTFCTDSITDPLVILLAYSKIKMELGKLDTDFKENPEFYNTILSELKKTYGETSYYLQFREEVMLLSHREVKKKYNFHKNLNYILALLVVIMILILLRVLKSNKELINKQTYEATSTLTKQEQKIANLIVKGKTNKEIASNLFISLNTVKTHISKIYSKLKVANRQQIIDKLKNHTKD